MTTKVRIPTQLRSLTSGVSEVSVEGDTVAELIATLDASHPGLGGRLLDDTGNLRRFINVYVGDEDVRLLDGLNTPIPDGSQVLIIPAVAGG